MPRNVSPFIVYMQLDNDTRRGDHMVRDVRLLPACGRAICRHLRVIIRTSELLRGLHDGHCLCRLDQNAVKMKCSQHKRETEWRGSNGQAAHGRNAHARQAWLLHRPPASMLCGTEYGKMRRC